MKTITTYDSSSAYAKHASRGEKLLKVLCYLRDTSHVTLARLQYVEHEAADLNVAFDRREWNMSEANVPQQENW